MQIEIWSSRRKYIRYLTTCLVFAGAGAVMILAPMNFPPNAAVAHLFVQAVGGFLILLFGIGAAVFAWFLLDRRPRLVFDDECVFDRTLHVGRISWLDVRNAYLFSV